MQVKDVMTKDVELVTPDMAIQDAAQRMRDHDTGFLPVREGDRLIGTITDRDITCRITADGKDPKSAHVRDAMSDHIFYVYDDQDTSEAAALMGEKQVRRLPVLNRDKRLVGVLSLGDIAEEGETGIAGQAEHDVSRPSSEPRH